MYRLNAPGWAAQLLYRKVMFAPDVRCVIGQSSRAAVYAEKSNGPPGPPSQMRPSGTKPTVRPAPSERRTANQLYSGVVPVEATAAAQAGLLGMIWPLGWMPSW